MYTGEDGLSRIDLDQSDPMLKDILSSKGIDLEEFERDPNQTLILSNALCGDNRHNTRHSVKENVERILGEPWDDQSRDTLYRCHRLRFLVMGHSREEYEEGKHIHYGSIQGCTEDDSCIYKDGITLRYLGEGILLINCFTVWSGYTWCERIYEIQVSDWCIRKYAYNAFGNGLCLVGAETGLGESSLEDYAESIIVERQTQGTWDWEREPRAEDVSYRIEEMDTTCTFSGSDGKRWAYNHQLLP